MRSRNLSRRDHVLNLLPPLTVANKEETSMFDRLFAEKPPSKNYPEIFPNKVLRHLGSWTFYSTPTKGELALLDKNMHHLDKDDEKTEIDSKKHTLHNAGETEPRLRSHDFNNDKKKLKNSKTKAAEADQKTQVQPKQQEEKLLQKETILKIQQEKISLTSKSTNIKSTDTNFAQNIRQTLRERMNNNVEIKRKIIKRRSSFNHSMKNLKISNTVNTRSQSVVGIKLRKSRGKVLGGADTGADIATEELQLTIEGHNVPVPDLGGVHGKFFTNCKEATQNVGNVLEDKEARESVKLTNNKRQDKIVRKMSRNSNCSPPCDIHRGNDVDGGTTKPQKTRIRKVTQAVIKIPLQENEGPEENDKATPKRVKDLDWKSNEDNLQFEGSVQGHNYQGKSMENVRCGLEEKDTTPEKRASCEKGQIHKKKRQKSQKGRKIERKRSGKSRLNRND